jgi:comEA protein
MSFSKLNEKTKTALLYTIGMVFFLLAGCFMYFSTKPQYAVQGAINTANDSSSSIQELYNNLNETAAPVKQVSMVKGVEQNNSQFEIQREQIEVDDRWVLYVTGSVQNPGVYRLPEGARVFQLVEAAGGLTATADAVAVNLAAHLQDGDHLHVPKKGDNPVAGNEARPSPGGTRATNATERNQKNSPGKPYIDINAASAAELQTLPGLGPSTSERIIQYRNKNGRFKRVSDLINVSGIGAKKLEAIEPFIFVR